MRVGVVVARRLIAGLALVGVVAAASAQYHLVLIPNPDWLPSMSPTAFNSAGDVAINGRFNSNDGAYRYSSGTLNLLSNGAETHGINSAGAIAGAFEGQAALWQGAIQTNLGFVPGDNQSTAEGVNDSLVVAGMSGYSNSGIYRPMVWQGGVMSALPLLMGANTGDARAINDAGRIVGTSETGQDPHARVVYWENGIVHEVPSLPQWAYSRGATAVNQHGDMVGWGEIDHYTGDENQIGAFRAFIYRNGIVTNLGSLSGGSIAYGLNESGWVVGSYGLQGPFNYSQIGFVWDGATMRNLNTLVDQLPPGYFIDSGVGIGDSGSILVRLDDGPFTHNFRTAILVPVAEPGALATVGLGVVFLLRRKRRPATV